MWKSLLFLAFFLLYCGSEKNWHLLFSEPHPLGNDELFSEGPIFYLFIRWLVWRQFPGVVGITQRSIQPSAHRKTEIGSPFFDNLGWISAGTPLLHPPISKRSHQTIFFLFRYLNWYLKKAPPREPFPFFKDFWVNFSSLDKLPLWVVDLRPKTSVLPRFIQTVLPRFIVLPLLFTKGASFLKIQRWLAQQIIRNATPCSWHGQNNKYY